MKAMILAAGFGKRLLPLTVNSPKALVRIGGKTLLEIVVRKLLRHGFSQIAVNVHHFADEIIAYAKNENYFGAEMHFFFEKELPLGTGGGIFNAQNFFKGSGNFLVHNTDVISDTDLSSLFRFHEESANTATLSVRKRTSPRALIFDNEGYLCGRTVSGSVPSPEKFKVLAYSGIQCVSTRIFDLSAPIPPFSIVDFYLKYSSSLKTGFFEDRSKYWFDAGKAETLSEIESSDLVF